MGWGTATWGATGGSGSADGTPPVVTNFNIAPGTPIGRYQQLEFDVTDNVGLAHVGLAVSYADGSCDYAFDGHDFRGQYTGTRTVIAGGFRFTLWRSGGWPSAPTIEYVPIDLSGNMGVIA